MSHSLGLAILARALVGAGDAMTFVSVLRLVTTWFPARRVPVVSQLTGVVGQLGQLLSAVPLVALLHRAGLDHGLPVDRLARRPGLRPGGDRHPGRAAGAASAGTAIGLARVLVQLRAAWLHPGTRLGLWTHFSTQFSGHGVRAAVGVPVPGVRPGAEHPARPAS